MVGQQGAIIQTQVDTVQVRQVRNGLDLLVVPDTTLEKIKITTTQKLP